MDPEDEIVPEAVDPQMPVPPTEEEEEERKKAQRPSRMKFSQLHTTLQSVEGVGRYVGEKSTELKDPRLMNQFLQALCGRDTAFYEQLFAEAKAEVLYVLDRIAEQSDSAKVSTLSPFVHEFVLRAEANGVKKPSWAVGIEPLRVAKNTSAEDVSGSTGTISLPMLSAKELIHALNERDPKGKCQRRVELANGAPELESCVKHFLRGQFSSMTPAEQSIVITRLISKCRRFLIPSSKKERASKRPRDDDERKEDAVEGAEEVNEEVVVETSEDVTPITPAGAENTLAGLIELCHKTYVERKIPGVSPPAKVKAFLSWGKPFVPGTHTQLFEELASDADEQVTKEVEQLEAVILLKGCTNDEEFGTLLDEKLCVAKGDDSQSSLKFKSPDVLSALAVAAGKLNDGSKAIAVRLLGEVQGELQSTGGALPRRAATFVIEERAKQRRKLMGPKPVEANGGDEGEKKKGTPADQQEDYVGPEIV